MSLQEFMWFFIVGSFLGYLLETLWYRRLRGKWICRKGVIYGPFSPVYGIAAAVFSKIFWKVKSIWYLFFWGCILGSIFEYLCGFLQEKILGTKSWDYSKKRFQLHGRICLEFTFYWGVIAVAVVYAVKPVFEKIYISICTMLSSDIAEYLVIGLFAALILDCVLSGLACLQQRNRREGNIIQNQVTRFLDKYYPDERLEKIFTETRIVGACEGNILAENLKV
ncbi:MAG: putative ABC transporter permease [Lachnospiraceae bacterium]|nr:putative ABC transporter permease [Lachnospiraceae bacterium]